jgi:hypothetical protein
MNHSRRRKRMSRKMSLSFTKAFTEAILRDCGNLSTPRWSEAGSRAARVMHALVDPFTTVYGSARASTRSMDSPTSMDRYLFIEAQAGNRARLRAFETWLNPSRVRAIRPGRKLRCTIQPRLTAAVELHSSVIGNRVVIAHRPARFPQRTHVVNPYPPDNNSCLQQRRHKSGRSLPPASHRP